MPQTATPPRELATARRAPVEIRGSITLNFGSELVYTFLSSLWPGMHPLTIYITDVPDLLNPDYHPIHGSKARKRIYRGWHYTQMGNNSKEGEVALKWVTGIDRVHKLEQERQNYARLEHLQGSVIPTIFDYIEGTVEGVDVACLLMDWCGAPLTKDHKLLCAQKLEVASRLHSAGVLHGSLLDRRSHHFVAVKLTKNGPRNPLRIIDLSCVTVSHPCPLNKESTSCRDCCWELDALAAMRLLNM